MSLLIGIQDLASLESRLTAVEQNDQSQDTTLDDHGQRIAALETASGLDPANPPIGRADLDPIIYAHCGNDDDPQMQLPAILRYTPATYEIIDTSTQYAIPRLILYQNGTLYDNAPANYQGGVAEIRTI